MGFPIAEGEFDVHAVPVERGIGGHEEKPRGLEGAVVEDDQIGRLAGGGLIGDVGVAPRPAEAMAQAAEAESLHPDVDDGAVTGPEDEGKVEAAEVRQERRARIARSRTNTGLHPSGRHAAMSTRRDSSRTFWLLWIVWYS